MNPTEHEPIDESTVAWPAADVDAVDEKDELRISIEQSEVEFREAVEEISAAVKSEVSIRSRISKRPWRWLLGAFAAGVMLARR